jgi:hypothetical protein
MSDSDRFLLQRIKQVERAKAMKQQMEQKKRGEEEVDEGLGTDDWDARESAIALLRYFVQAKKGSVPPMLGAYLQDCVKAWLDKDCDPRSSAASFNVERSAHRPKDHHDVRDGRVRALRCYYLLRGRHCGREAAITGAAKYADVTESTIKKLLEGVAKSPQGVDGELSSIQLLNASVLAGIEVRNPAVLRRCLHPRSKRYHRSR